MNNEHIEPSLRIVWQGTEIGLLTDMAYLEGIWVANETEEAKQFTSLAENSILSEVFKDLSSCTEISLLENENQIAVRATVISLEKERLFIRRIF